MNKLFDLLGERGDIGKMCRLITSAGCSNDEKDYMVRQLRHRRDGSAIDAKP
jgi:hypothetical protein